MYSRSLAQSPLRSPGLALAAARAPFLGASLSTGLLALVWSWLRSPSTFSWPRALVALLGLACVHLAANTMNDHADWDGSDAVNAHAGPLSGGSRHRMEGILQRWHFGLLTLLFGGCALLAGLGLALTGRPWVLLLGLAGGLLALEYSATPLRLMTRGLGEATVFVLFGPATTVGMAYAATGSLSPEAALLGISPGALVAAILWINEFPDAPADERARKRTLVVRLGASRARWGLVLLVAIHVVSLVGLASWSILPKGILAGLVPLPLALSGVRGCWNHYDKPDLLLGSQRAMVLHQVLAALAAGAGLLLQAST